MTWADWLVLLTMIVAFWGGYRSGAVREAIGLVSIIVAWIVAGSLAGSMTPAVQKALALRPLPRISPAFGFFFCLLMG